MPETAQPSDESDDTVHLVTNGGKTGVYHTNPDCGYLQKATSSREIPRDVLRDVVRECKRCAGTASAGYNTGNGHFESLARLGVAHDPLSNVEPEEEDA